MWIERDFSGFLKNLPPFSSLPVKVLKGPRQVGKTSLLDHQGGYRLVLFDDLKVRTLAQENPSLFFDQFRGPLILDEATLAPAAFPELKKIVDEQRRKNRNEQLPITADYWITGSNQTLLQASVRESLAGRASYFLLNTLSIHELNRFNPELTALRTLIMKGGWPELYVTPQLSPVQYLNDFIVTFIEKDIVGAAGIEKKSAFSRLLSLVSGRTAQLLNYSDLARNLSVDLTTVQSWIALLEQNGIVRVVPPYFSNLNQRLIKSPKIYFEDVALNVRLQGWSEFDPLFLSPYLGGLIETLALGEVTRFFSNRGMSPEVYFLRSKEKVEVDFLIQLPNRRMVAAEVKTTAVDFTPAQIKLLDSLELEGLERWILTPQSGPDFRYAKTVALGEIYENLEKLVAPPLTT